MRIYREIPYLNLSLYCLKIKAKEKCRIDK